MTSRISAAGAGLCLLAASLTLSCGASASSGNRPIEEPGSDAPTAEEVLARCVGAIGGPEALEEPGSLHRRSRARFHPGAGPAVDAEVRYWRQDGRERLEIHPDGRATLVQVWGPDGGREWEGERPTGRDPGEDARRRDHRALLRAMVAGEASLVGVQEVEGRRQWVLERATAEDRLWRVWIDDESALPARILCSEPSGTGRRIQQDFLFEPRFVAGRWVPHRQVSTLDGRKVSETWLLEYELDQPVDERAFDLDNLYNL